MADSLEFKPRQKTLDNSALWGLSHLAPRINRETYVEGGASGPNNEVNQKYAADRANEVIKALIDRGVDPSLLKVKTNVPGISEKDPNAAKTRTVNFVDAEGKPIDYSTPIEQPKEEKKQKEKPVEMPNKNKLTPDIAMSAIGMPKKQPNFWNPYKVLPTSLNSQYAANNPNAKAMIEHAWDPTDQENKMEIINAQLDQRRESDMMKMLLDQQKAGQKLTKEQEKFIDDRYEKLDKEFGTMARANDNLGAAIASGDNTKMVQYKNEVINQKLKQMAGSAVTPLEFMRQVSAMLTPAETSRLADVMSAMYNADRDAIMRAFSPSTGFVDALQIVAKTGLMNQLGVPGTKADSEMQALTQLALDGGEREFRNIGKVAFKGVPAQKIHDDTESLLPSDYRKVAEKYKTQHPDLFPQTPTPSEQKAAFKPTKISKEAARKIIPLLQEAGVELSTFPLEVE